MGEHYLHKFAMFLYGGEGSIHPVLLARPADVAAWSFRWERMIQSTVAHQLSENGGDTVGGCVVVRGSLVSRCSLIHALRAHSTFMHKAAAAAAAASTLVLSLLLFFVFRLSHLPLPLSLSLSLSLTHACTHAAPVEHIRKTRFCPPRRGF